MSRKILRYGVVFSCVMIMLFSIYAVYRNNEIENDSWERRYLIVAVKDLLLSDIRNNIIDSLDDTNISKYMISDKIILYQKYDGPEYYWKDINAVVGILSDKTTSEETRVYFGVAVEKKYVIVYDQNGELYCVYNNPFEQDLTPSIIAKYLLGNKWKNYHGM